LSSATRKVTKETPLKGERVSQEKKQRAAFSLASTSSPPLRIPLSVLMIELLLILKVGFAD
jgi:hypothetical protein